MSKFIIIDQSYSDESYAAFVSDGKLASLCVTNSKHKQMRGNIYLGIVKRIEPSLQAVFVDYGGLKCGFLAFDDIHPAYYQIPSEDRERIFSSISQDVQQEMQAENQSDQDAVADAAVLIEDKEVTAKETIIEKEDKIDEDELFEHQQRAFRKRIKKLYSIQEVIKHGQPLLVQVHREERGNKGVSLTTYIALAGRYSVLMPNTRNHRGISKKISNNAERARLKKLLQELDLSKDASLTIRTAASGIRKQSIRSDIQNLLSIWSNIMEKTGISDAPCLIHEENDPIRHMIRDIFDPKIIESVLVQGKQAYTRAKEVMKEFLPSQLKNVKEYKDLGWIFSAYGVDQQIYDLHKRSVPLPSGGTLIIDQCEAMTTVDVNSAKDNSSHSVERTALVTNVEAAKHLALHIQLRSISGLIVIDFIDMQNQSNRRKVENIFAQHISNDRARISIKPISSLGIMEVSRQHISSSLKEVACVPCPMCNCKGHVRSASSIGIQALQALATRLQNTPKLPSDQVTILAHPEIISYLSNEHRQALMGLEAAYSVRLYLSSLPEIGYSSFRIMSQGQVLESTDRSEASHRRRIKSKRREDDVSEESAPTEVARVTKRKRNRGRKFKHIEVNAVNQEPEAQQAEDQQGTTEGNRRHAQSNAPRQDAPLQDAPRQDAPLQDAPRQDSSRKGQDAPLQDATRQDSSRKGQDAPLQDATRQDSSRKGQDTPRKDAPRRAQDTSSNVFVPSNIQLNDETILSAPKVDKATSSGTSRNSHGNRGKSGNKATSKVADKATSKDKKEITVEPTDKASDSKEKKSPSSRRRTSTKKAPVVLASSDAPIIDGFKAKKSSQNDKPQQEKTI